MSLYSWYSIFAVNCTRYLVRQENNHFKTFASENVLYLKQTFFFLHLALSLQWQSRRGLSFTCLPEMSLALNLNSLCLSVCSSNFKTACHFPDFLPDNILQWVLIPRRCITISVAIKSPFINPMTGSFAVNQWLAILSRLTLFYWQSCGFRHLWPIQARWNQWTWAFLMNGFNSIHVGIFLVLFISQRKLEFTLNCTSFTATFIKINICPSFQPSTISFIHSSAFRWQLQQA